MKTRMIFAVLALTLTACAPAQTGAADVQNTAIAIAQTGIALTQTALPANTPLPTGTAAFIAPTETPGLQSFVPIFTPDAIQVEKWQEYQTELAKVLLYGYGPDAYKYSLCEWDILGRSDQEVYVWAFCALAEGGNGRLPAVIYLETNGSIQKVTIPAINNSTWDSQIQTMFPADVREKLDLYYFNVCVYCGRPEELRIHLLYRQIHPEVPPLIVLSSMPAATPTP